MTSKLEQCHAKIDSLQRQCAQLKTLCRNSYQAGFIAGLEAYAWWKDGVQYVGSCGTTLKKAIAEAEKGR